MCVRAVGHPIVRSSSWRTVQDRSTLPMRRAWTALLRPAVAGASAALLAASSSASCDAATSRPAPGVVAAAAATTPSPAAIKAGTMSVAAFASRFDHTLLRADAQAADIHKLCVEAHEYGFASVCVNPSWVREAREWLEALAARDGMARTVRVCTVIGFPLGANTARVKAFEAQAAIEDGAEELDMVVAVGRLREPTDVAPVMRDLCAVSDVVAQHRHRGVTLKVILETALLTPEERELGVFLAAQAGADFVKTSTGFAKAGATESDVRAMSAAAAEAASVYSQPAPSTDSTAEDVAGTSVRGRRASVPRMRVKASGGIRTCAQALTMIAAGADRIGASSSTQIVDECIEAGRIVGEKPSRAAAAADAVLTSDPSVY